jgi:hypothetical protein
MLSTRLIQFVYEIAGDYQLGFDVIDQLLIMIFDASDTREGLGVQSETI